MVWKIRYRMDQRRPERGQLRGQPDVSALGDRQARADVRSLGPRRGLRGAAMNKQRGIIAAIYLYGFAALAALGVIYGVYSWIDYPWETSAGIKRGEANKQAAWNDANRKARAAEESARAERDRLAGEQSARLAVAEGRARDADANWRRARSAAARASVPLVVADCTGPAGGVSAPAPGGGGLRLATSMRFSHQFVREWDDAWTDAAGKPVFG